MFEILYLDIIFLNRTRVSLCYLSLFKLTLLFKLLCNMYFLNLSHIHSSFDQFVQALDITNLSYRNLTFQINKLTFKTGSNSIAISQFSDAPYIVRSVSTYWVGCLSVCVFVCPVIWIDLGKWTQCQNPFFVCLLVSHSLILASWKHI